MSQSSQKSRIALLAMGILGEDKMGQGIPVLTDLFKRLSDHFDIVLYSFSPIDVNVIPEGIKARQIPSLPLPGRLKYLILSFYFLLDHFRNPFDVLFAVSVFPPGQWAVMLGKLVKRKVLVQIIALEAVSLPDIKAGYLYHPWHRKITTEVCKQADVLIAVAEYQKRIAQQSLPTDREIVVLPLRINPQNFRYIERPVAYPVQFIHIAYYSPIKDQHTMFRAFAKVAQVMECHLTVIGSGYHVPEVPELLKSLGIREMVTLVGEVRQSDLPRYFDTAHILLHTARFETGCAVIQEAMASGVAVCGTDVGILADIGERYAVITPTQDPDLLATKIISLVNNPQLYASITKEAYLWINRDDAIWSFRNYLDFLSRFLQKNIK
jgi:glycosyltransferase involved in cell wall biosynthesis